MRILNVLIVLIMLVGCKSIFQRSNSENNFVGKIYMLESSGDIVFFQFTSNDSISYYSKTDVGEHELSKRSGFWKIKNDTTIMMKLIYMPDFENEEFELIYNREMDYWIGTNGSGVYRRWKKIALKSFVLEEF